MFLPLTGYYVSDPDVVFEPMTDHLAEYSWGLAQYLGAGVAACYRGHRVFDSPATRCKSDFSFKFECFFPREVVRTWVSFYKKHREVLGADLVHVRRPNMQVGVKRNKKKSKFGLLCRFGYKPKKHLNTIGNLYK